MMATTKTRTERRMEKKQALLLLVLVLAVSLASFTLGVVVGRRGVERDLALKQQAAEKILVAKAPTQSVAGAAPQAEQQVAEQAPLTLPQEQPAGDPKLTFYDSLAKEDTAPLGSGINLPPATAVVAKKTTQPPINLPDVPIVKKTTPTVTLAKVASVEAMSIAAESADLPASDPKGDFAVQVGSFAAAGDAGAFRQRLISKGLPAFVVEADLGSKGLWYRVRLGPYADAAVAKEVQLLVEKKEQIKGFISHQ